MQQLPLLIVLAVGAVLGIVGLRRAWRRAARAEEIPAVAAQAGLAYQEDDPFNCTAVAFPLFRAGDGRVVEHVMWRDHPAPESTPPHAGPVRVFDYSYYEEYRDRSGQLRKQWRYYTCALAQHDGSWPSLRAAHENVLDKAEHLVSDEDIDFESEEFNRAFAVHCDDRRFASALIDPQMMTILLKAGGLVSLDTMGRFVLLSTEQVDPPVMPRLLAMAEDVLAHVPPAVWELYPAGPETSGSATDPGLAAGPGPDRAPERPGAWEPFDPTPSLVHPDERWDPTPGVDHDLDGHVVEPVQEDPWHDRP